MKIKRRVGRERALQLLCQFDMNPPQDIDAAIKGFWELEQSAADEDTSLNAQDGGLPGAEIRGAAALPPEERAFTEERARGAWEARKELDALLENVIKNWEIYRLGTVERNTLRLGAWEILNKREVPSAVVVNEAVDLAKYFSSSGAGRFVNGVLDKIVHERRNGRGKPESTAEKADAE